LDDKKTAFYVVAFVKRLLLTTPWVWRGECVSQVLGWRGVYPYYTTQLEKKRDTDRKNFRIRPVLGRARAPRSGVCPGPARGKVDVGGKWCKIAVFFANVEMHHVGIFVSAVAPGSTSPGVLHGLQGKPVAWPGGWP
jgi:hypothetical protein